MELIRRICAAVAAAFFALNAFGTTLSPELILLPVVVSHARDASGNAWNSRVSFEFAGETPVDVFNDGNLELRLLQPGERGELALLADQQNAPGILIVTNTPASQSLSIQTLVFNEASPATATAIPAVRARDLQADQPVHLIGVPIVADARTLLRIYDVSLKRDADVSVRLFDSRGTMLTAEIVHLTAPPLRPLQTIPSHPAYAEYRLPIDSAAHTSVFIDVQPLQTGALLWAFTTTTDRSDRAVTAVFPSR